MTQLASQTVQTILDEFKDPLLKSVVPALSARAKSFVVSSSSGAPKLQHSHAPAVSERETEKEKSGVGGKLEVGRAEREKWGGRRKRQALAHAGVDGNVCVSVSASVSV